MKESKPSHLQKLHRWAKRGWIVPMRRGFYAFPDELAKGPLTPERAANQLYGLSYVSGLWRLSQEGLIPEGATAITSATLNNTAEFKTPRGYFVYQHLSPRGYFGYQTDHDGPWPVLLATPEKALLDFFWWKRVEWTEAEFDRWRFQDPWKKIDRGRLLAYADRWEEPRLQRAAKNLLEYLP